MTRALVVMGKVPKPGRVKTRLARSLGPDAACSLYEAFLDDVLQMAARAARALDLVPFFSVATDGAEDLEAARRLTPSPVSVFEQRGEGLGARIEHARFSAGSRRVVVIGSDAPLLDEARVSAALEALESHDAVVGGTSDGGYDLIGFDGPRPELLQGIPWSTDQVLEQTLQRARDAGLRCLALPRIYDVDDVEDLLRLAADPDLERAPRTAQALAVGGWV